MAVATLASIMLADPRSRLKELSHDVAFKNSNGMYIEFGPLHAAMSLKEIACRCALSE
jgi:hypothetical protein